MAEAEELAYTQAEEREVNTNLHSREIPQAAISSNQVSFNEVKREAHLDGVESRVIKPEDLPDQCTPLSLLCQLVQSLSKVSAKSSCDVRVWVLPKRQNKMAERGQTLYWIVREIIQRTLAIIPWHSFAASNSEGANYFFSRSFSVLFNFSPANKYLY